MKQRPASMAAPSTLAQVLRPLVDAMGAVVRTRVSEPPFQRDPAFIARMLPLIQAVNLYFGTEVRGWEHLPARGPFLIVANHSGGAENNDLWFFLQRWIEERGADAPLYSLAYDMLFAYPYLGPTLRRFGIIPANPANGRRALEMGAAVMVFPGGDYEVFRPWSERNRIRFGERMGFIELALSTGVPVVPMTIHGAHQSTFTLTRGRWIARLLGIDRLHVNVFPLVWNIPFGLTPAFVPSVQLPAKVTVQLDRPFDWSRFAARIGDPAVLRRCYDAITTRMQRTLDALVEEHPYPVLERIDALRPSRLWQLAVGGERPPAATIPSRGAVGPQRRPKSRDQRRSAHRSTRQRT